MTSGALKFWRATYVVGAMPIPKGHRSGETSGNRKEGLDHGWRKFRGDGL